MVLVIRTARCLGAFSTLHWYYTTNISYPNAGVHLLLHTQSNPIQSTPTCCKYTTVQYSDAASDDRFNAPTSHYNVFSLESTSHPMCCCSSKEKDAGGMWGKGGRERGGGRRRRRGKEKRAPSLLPFLHSFQRSKAPKVVQLAPLPRPPTSQYS